MTPLSTLEILLDRAAESWLVPTQNITTVSAWLRVLDFGSYSMSVLRQMPPLPAVMQPQNGHSLAFYIVAGKRDLPLLAQSCLQPVCPASDFPA